ncbi:MAG: DUF1217 domain-containing protein [Pseudomonadota bacterium]|jgi:hypothetical protein
MDTYTSYQLIAKDIPKAIDQVESQPVVKRDTDYYLANIGSIKSIDDFVKNTRLFNYAMKAYGLGDMAYAKAFMVKALKEGVSSQDSFANKLSDKRYAAFVKAFNFAAYGSTATLYPSAQQGAVDAYMRQTLEENAGETNQGVRLALYFQRKAPTINTWYDVLADTALSNVVRTTLGLPDTFAAADIDKQAQAFGQKLNIADFKDPTKLSKFLNRFTTMWEINNPTSSATTSVSVLFAQPTSVGISTDLMMAMQKLKF